MPVERHRLLHLNARNRGLRRLQVITRVLAVATVVLTGLFTAIAAQSYAGRKHVRRLRVVKPAARPTRAAKARSTTVPPPPSLPPLSAGEQSQPSPSPAPPAQAPQPSYSPPAVVSGGS